MKTTKFLLFASNAGNGSINYHIREIENPKAHEKSQSVGIYNIYDEAKIAKDNLIANPASSFNKPH